MDKNYLNERIRVNSHKKSRKKLTMEGILILYLIYHAVATVYLAEALPMTASSIKLLPVLILPLTINLVLIALVITALIVGVYSLASYPYYYLLREKVFVSKLKEVQRKCISVFLGTLTLSFISFLLFIRMNDFEYFLHGDLSNIINLDIEGALFISASIGWILFLCLFFLTISFLLVIGVLLLTYYTVEYLLLLFEYIGYYTNKTYYKTKEFLSIEK